jgi:hypothetical protein
MSKMSLGYYIEKLCDKDPRIRKQAVEEIGESKVLDAQEYLKKMALEDPDLEVKIAIGTVLIELMQVEFAILELERKIEELGNPDLIIQDHAREYLRAYLGIIPDYVETIPAMEQLTVADVKRRKAVIKILKEKGIDLLYFVDKKYRADIEYKKQMEEYYRGKDTIKNILISIGAIFGVLALLYLGVLLFKDDGISRAISALKWSGISLIGLIFLMIGYFRGQWELKQRTLWNPSSGLFLLAGIVMFIAGYVCSVISLFGGNPIIP